MPDDGVDKSKLEWVVEPHIEDGRVVYTYRNGGGLAADMVSEMVQVAHSAGNGSQAFQLQALAPGAQQETHAPVGHDIGDGPVSVSVSVQSARNGQSEWDSTLEATVTGHGQGGVLTAGPPQGATAPTGTLTLDLVDAHLDGEDLVIQYRVAGNVPIILVGATAQLVHDGQTRWMGGETESMQREGLVRMGIPLDLVDSDRWQLQVDVVVAGQNDVSSRAVLHMQLAFDNGTVTNGGFAVTTGV